MPELGFFALRLKELRARAGLSQAGLAARAGLSSAAIKGWEQGWRDPAFETLLKVCAGLGCGLQAFNTDELAKLPDAPKPGKKAPTAGRPKRKPT